MDLCLCWVVSLRLRYFGLFLFNDILKWEEEYKVVVQLREASSCIQEGGNGKVGTICSRGMFKVDFQFC